MGAHRLCARVTDDARRNDAWAPSTRPTLQGFET